LAVNKYSISHVASRWSKQHQQNLLLICMNNGRHVAVFEDAANDVLEDLGLGQFVGDWVLDLEKDLG
jgi:hypothetical protein